ncbi:MAG: hypothetical protein ACTHKS_11390 [Gaiellaceae bacterium]
MMRFLLCFAAVLGAASASAVLAASAAAPEYATDVLIVTPPAQWHLVARTTDRVELASPRGRVRLIAEAERHAVATGVAPRVQKLLRAVRSAGGVVVRRTHAVSGDPRWDTVTYRLQGRLVLAAVADDGVGDAIVVHALLPARPTVAERAFHLRATSFVARADLGD